MAESWNFDEMKMAMPYRHLGQSKKGGIVCVADHASNSVPEDIELGIKPCLLKDHIALDIGVEGIAIRMAQKNQIAAHLCTVSRLVCDMHREETHKDVVPLESDGHLIPGNIGADVESRLERFYRPYHLALSRWLNDAQPKLIISLHSFTPRLRSRKEARPWEVSLLYNEDGVAARYAISMFSKLGLKVGENMPYSGKVLNATMNRHAEKVGRSYLAIEVRQDLISTPTQQARWAVMIADVANRVALRV